MKLQMCLACVHSIRIETLLTWSACFPTQWTSTLILASGTLAELGLWIVWFTLLLPLIRDSAGMSVECFKQTVTMCSMNPMEASDVKTMNSFVLNYHDTTSPEQEIDWIFVFVLNVINLKNKHYMLNWLLLLSIHYLIQRISQCKMRFHIVWLCSFREFLRSL